MTGGIDLAAEWAGFTTVGQCEWADYPTKVLEKHWPDVPRWKDVRTVTRESFQDRTGLRTVDLVSGGFPCQPFSVAGKQRGEDDDRFLWPEMLRVISELKPTWVLGENVFGIVNMALDQVLFDLEHIGYETQAFIVPACAVDAPHRRNRVFILAYAKGGDDRGNAGKFQSADESAPTERQEKRTSKLSCAGQDVADTESVRQQGERSGWEQVAKTHGRPFVSVCNGGDRTEWPTQSGLGGMVDGFSSWSHEPDIPRVATGIKNRTDRLKCLGNAVVPQQVYPILQAIADIEEAM